MLRDMANWREPAARIEAILGDLLARDVIKPRDFSPTYYAAFIARIAIGENDYVSALRALRLGLSFNTADEQLLFLTRVLDRIIPPEMLEEFKKKEMQQNQGVI